MKIILLRHGKPTFLSGSRVCSAALPDWIAQYDLAGISDETLPAELHNLIRNDLLASSTLIVSSDLRRSIVSAELIEHTFSQHASAAGVTFSGGIRTSIIFREAQLPFLNFKWPLLSPKKWIVILRLLWFAGLSKNAESFCIAKIRAGHSAKWLIDNAANQPVLFVGHGVINVLLAKHLESQNWRKTESSGTGYWSYRVYEKNNY